MDLLIDMGNSRVKGAFHQRASAASCRLGELRPLPAIDSGAGDLRLRLSEHWTGPEAPAHIYCSNVGHSAIANEIDAWSQATFGLEPTRLLVQTQACGVRNRYARLDQLGVDRWLAAVAGFHRAAGACCVVDCGTAVNVEFVTADGDYIGGMIAPGPTLMENSLLSNTAGLVRAVDLRAEGIGSDTESGIAAGVGHALRGLLERIVATARDLLSVDPVWLMTGGAAARIAHLAPVPFVDAPLLVLEGIALVTGEQG